MVHKNAKVLVDETTQKEKDSLTEVAEACQRD
jgi:hypothetical protein